MILEGCRLFRGWLGRSYVHVVRAEKWQIMCLTLTVNISLYHITCIDLLKQTIICKCIIIIHNIIKPYLLTYIVAYLKNKLTNCSGF